MRSTARLFAIMLTLAVMTGLAAQASLAASSAKGQKAGHPGKTGQALAPGFDVEAFRKNFVAGLTGRPNLPPLTPESVHVEAAEKAAAFAGTEIYVVKGQLAGEDGQAQPFLMFVSADGQFYVSDIVDMRAGKSILKDARDRMRAAELKELGHVVYRGTGKAVVTFVSDPFCPYCRTAYAYLMGKGAAYSDFRLAHYPLPSHPGADMACTLMSWAADKAPGRVAEFVRFAYTDLPLPKTELTQEGLKKARNQVAEAFLERFAELKVLGKNGEAIVAALAGSPYVESVKADIAKATGLDINGTPVVFVGTARVEGFDEARLGALLK